MDQITFRTNDPTRWGTGFGADLTATQIDINFWVLYTALLSIQDHQDASAGIDHILVSGDQLTFILTNHVALGPFVLPVAAFNFRFEWQANQQYNVNDVFSQDGAIYLVIFPVANSGATFFAGSNDGAGHNFYALMIAAAPSELPATGAAGAFLQMGQLDSPDSVQWTNLTRNIAFYIENDPDPLEVVIGYVFTETCDFPAALTGSRGVVNDPPTTGQAYELVWNGAPIGSINVASGTGVVTFTFPHDVTFEPGDVLHIVAPSVPDPHMTLFAVTLVGTLP